MRGRRYSSKKARVIVTLVASFITIISLVLVSFQPVQAAISARSSGVSTGDNAGGATSLTITKPSGAAAGDVMIAIIGVRGGTGVTVTATGWTAVTATGTATSSTTLRGSAFYRVVTASEASSYSFSFGGATQKASGVISTYSGVDTASPINVAAVQANASSITMTAPSVTTTVANTMLVGGYSNATGTTFSAGSSFTLRGQDASTGGSATTRTTTGLQDAAQAAAGASGTKTMTAASGAVSVGHLIALRPAPSIVQASYRFFQNTNATTAGTPYAPMGVRADIAPGDPFRLRLNLGVNTTDSSTATTVVDRSFTLQYAPRGADNSCDTSFSGETYQDVTTSSTVRFYDNTTPANGASYSANANDPTRSGVTAVGQKYQESNPLAMRADIPVGQDGLWDVALTTSGAASGQVYCLRVLNTIDASLLTGGYNVVPEFSVAYPAYSQANYRWLANADSSTPGAALAPQDTATSVAPSTPVRLRQRIGVDQVDLAAGAQGFKLQYAEKSGTCDTGFSGESYADVSVANSTQASPGTVVSVVSGSDTDWSNPQSASADDGAVASAMTTGFDSYSGDLKASAFGFAIPAGATVQGVEATVKRSASSQNSNGYVSDTTLTLGTGGATATKTDTSQWVKNVSEVVTYGSPTDLWGLALTPASVNSASFFFSLDAYLYTPNTAITSASVDSITLKVYYTMPTVGTFLTYFDNPSATSGSTITSTASDPTNGARSTVLQTYQETDPYTNAATIARGSDGLWDMALTTDSSAIGKTFCFRMVKADGSLLTTYTMIPELTIAGGTSGPALDQQLRGGQSVRNGVRDPFSW